MSYSHWQGSAAALHSYAYGSYPVFSRQYSAQGPIVVTDDYGLQILTPDLSRLACRYRQWIRWRWSVQSRWHYGHRWRAIEVRFASLVTSHESEREAGRKRDARCNHDEAAAPGLRIRLRPPIASAIVVRDPPDLEFAQLTTSEY